MGASMMMPMDTTSAPTAAPTVPPPSALLNNKPSDAQVSEETAQATAFWDSQTKLQNGIANQNTAYIATQKNQTVMLYMTIGAIVVFIMLIVKQ